MKRLLVVSVTVACACVLLVGLSGCRKKQKPAPPDQAQVDAAKKAVEGTPATTAPSQAPLIPPEAGAQAKAAQDAMKEAAAKGLVPPNVPMTPPAPEDK